jgi:DNA recombination protein RmuC
MIEMNLLVGIAFGLGTGGAVSWLMLRTKQAAELSILQTNIIQLESALNAELEQSEIRIKGERERSEERIAWTNQQADTLINNERQRSDELIAAEKAKSKEQLETIKSAREELKLTFQNMAQQAIDKNTDKLTNKNQTEIKALLLPLQEKILSFEKRVNDTAQTGSEANAKLREKIDGLSGLNEKLHKDAKELTQALRGQSKTRGDWGELQLLRVLEMSGLEEGVSFTQQVSGTTDDGHTRKPDVIINLPDDRKIIIDSKLSLVAYSNHCSATEEVDRKQYIKSHVSAVKLHIKQLSEKNYSSLHNVDSLDFVLMFIPIEGAYAAALAEDPTLIAFAIKRNVGVVTPSTLLVTLRTIENMWRLDSQNKNAQNIADLAGKLYDKFAAFTDDMIKLDKNLATARGTYDKAFNKLKSGKGNIVKRAEELKRLGAKTAKSLNVESIEAEFEVASEEDSQTHLQAQAS